MSALYGSPALVPSGDGRLELFVFDIEGDLWHIYQTDWSNGWTTFEAFGSASVWPVVGIPSGDGRLEIFVGGGDLFHNYQTAWSNGWDGWSAMGTPRPIFEGDIWAPGLAANANGEVMAFIVMTDDGSMWRLQQTAWSNGWGAWQSHGTPPEARLDGPVEAVRSGDGRVEVFVVDDGGTLWNVRQTSPSSGFSGWNDFGNPGEALEDRPALARSADGRIELFVRGEDGALYHQWQTAVGTFTWSGWSSMGNPVRGGGGFADHPTVAPSADGRLELFVTGTDGNVWHTWQTSASNGWADWDQTQPPPGAGAFGPVVAPSGDRRLELFVVGRDGNLWHQWQTAASNGWSDWTSHGQP